MLIVKIRTSKSILLEACQTTLKYTIHIIKERVFNMKTAKLLLAALVIMVMCTTTGMASSINDDFSNYFTPQYVDPEDLGDYSIAIPVLCGCAGAAAIGAIVTHKKRIRNH